MNLSRPKLASATSESSQPATARSCGPIWVSAALRLSEARLHSRSTGSPIMGSVASRSWRRWDGEPGAEPAGDGSHRVDQRHRQHAERPDQEDEAQEREEGRSEPAAPAQPIAQRPRSPSHGCIRVWPRSTGRRWRRCTKRWQPTDGLEVREAIRALVEAIVLVPEEGTLRDRGAGRSGGDPGARARTHSDPARGPGA